MSNIGKVLKKMSSSEKSLVRHGLSSATRRYSSSYKKVRTPHTEARLYCSLLETMEGYYQVCAIISTSCHVMFILIAGVLLYFSDGLLPLLQAYYEVFFEPPQDAYSRERQMNTSAKIATALLVWEVTKINLCS